MTNSHPTIHILLATYQGAKHLREQLDSIAAQSYQNWTLLVSDDGSTDDTLEIAQRFAATSTQKVTLLQGPRRGPTFNFFHLINSVEYESTSDLFAFCDQDDFWFPEKLAVAAKHHSQHSDRGAPNLYCSRTLLTNKDLVVTGNSATPRRCPTFGNALTQNIASGNTMVFTVQLLEILRMIRPEYSVWHDWSTYQVATACGGKVHLDVMPQLLYRQHENNVVGATSSEFRRLKQLYPVLKGRYRNWGELTEFAMQQISSHMTDEAKQILVGYQAARHAKTALSRVGGALGHGIRRQTKTEQIAFLLIVFLGLA